MGNKVQITERSLAVFLVVALLIFSGCKSQKAPSKEAVKPPKPVVAAPPPPATEAKVEQETYDYDNKGRRDPFVSLAEIAKEKPSRKPGKRPIENFDVDEIKLVAIMWDSNQYYALITLPDNKSYTIRKGTTMGLYGGSVVDINKDRVLIREQVKDYRGQPKIKDTILKLRKEGE